jgi:hypothetical protein
VVKSATDALLGAPLVGTIPKEPEKAPSIIVEPLRNNLDQSEMLASTKTQVGVAGATYTQTHDFTLRNVLLKDFIQYTDFVTNVYIIYRVYIDGVLARIFEGTPTTRSYIPLGIFYDDKFAEVNPRTIRISITFTVPLGFGGNYNSTFYLAYYRLENRS